MRAVLIFRLILWHLNVKTVLIDCYYENVSNIYVPKYKDRFYQLLL